MASAGNAVVRISGPPPVVGRVLSSKNEGVADGLLELKGGRVTASTPLVNVCPPLVDLATVMPSGVFAAATVRQATYTFPVEGSTAIATPWFNGYVSLNFFGELQVAPQSVDLEK